MKNLNLFIFTFLVFIFPFKNDVKSQSLEAGKIQLTIENIPKIKHRTQLSPSSYRIDKSPTITYRLKGEYKSYPLKFNAVQKKLSKQFDNDTIYLKLRYNPGKSQLYILRRGDIASIKYIFGQPYLELKNRAFKKHDIDVSIAIDKFKANDKNMIFSFNSIKMKNSKNAKKQAIKAYDKILTSLDSLSKENFLSNAEYSYYKKLISYKKELKTGKFKLGLLKKNDLHVEGYELYLRQYAFSNLKKKIISLGNGMARNSLEGFDFVFTSNAYSEKNKNYLLLRYLKNIKIDFTSTTYKNRCAKYETMFSIKNKENLLTNNSTFLKSIYKTTKDVELVDFRNNTTTLKEVIDQNKGKVIYLDFWTSWCAPCRQAFPSYKDLKKEYNEKDIVFIFISGDKNSEKWRKAEAKEKLTNSYLAINFSDAKFYKELNLNSFPRYLIFDRNGQLDRESIPGPDSDNIRDFINELISR
jgi:thiol-disulfide isomerase/thioredoxin